MEPTIGRIVIYCLSEEDAAKINRRRTSSESIALRIKEEKWPFGAQAHIGNYVRAGQEFPMMVVAVWSPTTINGQVFLDGNDTYWALSRLEGEREGTWHWPVKENV